MPRDPSGISFSSVMNKIKKPVPWDLSLEDKD
jgi:hypothetical protein